MNIAPIGINFNKRHLNNVNACANHYQTNLLKSNTKSDSVSFGQSLEALANTEPAIKTAIKILDGYTKQVGEHIEESDLKLLDIFLSKTKEEYTGQGGAIVRKFEFHNQEDETYLDLHLFPDSLLVSLAKKTPYEYIASCRKSVTIDRLTGTITANDGTITTRSGFHFKEHDVPANYSYLPLSTIIENAYGILHRA